MLCSVSKCLYVANFYSKMDFALMKGNINFQSSCFDMLPWYINFLFWDSFMYTPWMSVLGILIPVIAPLESNMGVFPFCLCFVVVWKLNFLYLSCEDGLETLFGCFTFIILLWRANWVVQTVKQNKSKCCVICYRHPKFTNDLTANVFSDEPFGASMVYTNLTFSVSNFACFHPWSQLLLC